MTGRNVSEICEIDGKVVRLLVLRLLVCHGRNHECAAIESKTFNRLTNSINQKALGEYGCFSMESSYLVDPASSHMLVSKIKPCMSKYKQICTVKLRMAH